MNHPFSPFTRLFSFGQRRRLETRHFVVGRVRKKMEQSTPIDLSLKVSKHRRIQASEANVTPDKAQYTRRSIDGLTITPLQIKNKRIFLILRKKCDIYIYIYCIS